MSPPGQPRPPERPQHLPGVCVPDHVEGVGHLRHPVKVEAARVARHAAHVVADQALARLIIGEEQSRFGVRGPKQLLNSGMFITF